MIRLLDHSSNEGLAILSRVLGKGDHALGNLWTDTAGRAGVSDVHAWGLMLPSSSGVSPITYHSVVAVRYPDLCRCINSAWELGSFASGGIPSKPQGSNSYYGTPMPESMVWSR